MSDDEDDPDQLPNEPRTFISFEPEWRHQQVSLDASHASGTVH